MAKAIGTLISIGLLYVMSVPATCQIRIDCSCLRWQKYQAKHQDPFFVSVLKDMGLIVKNIFDWDSYKIIASSFPLLIASRIADNRVQNCFYDSCCHKNIHQLPWWTHKFADVCVFLPVATLGALLVGGPIHELRTASRVFLSGLPFVWLGKDLIKQCKTEINLRPWNEYYSHYNRAYGGFPSGHIAASMYITLFWGRCCGRKFSIPLGLATGCIGITYLSSNRHYLSQLIGGAVWGALWAYAASKVVEHDFDKDYHFRLGLNTQGCPEIEMSYSF